MGAKPTRVPEGRRARPVIELEVRRTERLTGHMVRVVLGGPGLSDYAHNEFTDRYVKLNFPVEGGGPGATVVRTYTVRGHDPVAGEIWIDVVQHGDVGVAGPWAAAVQPGGRIELRGPGGAYRPDPAADWHLFVGDPAAFPAIASAIESLPTDAVVIAVLRAHDLDEAAYVPLPPRASVRWLIDDDTSFADVLDAHEVPVGLGQAFVHGELDEVRSLRPVLERWGVSGERLSLSGYWRRGLDEEAFQQAKRVSA